jgi:hypothetical protein
MTLAQAILALKEYRFPLEQLNCTIRLGDGRLEIEQLRLRALNGEIFIEGAVDLTPERDARLAITARNIDLKELIDSNARSQTSLSGKLNSGVMLEVPMRVLRAKMRQDSGAPASTQFADEPWPPRWGTGSLEISNGYLVTLPVLSQINTVVSTTLNLGRSPAGGNEQLSMQFEMNEDKFNFSEIAYIGSAIAGRGKGHIALDQTVDIRLNGGPVERVQGMLGKTVGGALAKITDSLAGYHVTGTIKDPKVSLEVAPGFFGGFNPLKPLNSPHRNDR